MLCGALPLRHSPKRRASLRLALRCAGLSCFLWSPCFAGYKQRNSALVQRKDPLLTSALAQKARVSAEANLKGAMPTGEPSAAPCPAALCGRVLPWSNNYPQRHLDVVTAITLKLSVVVDHTGRALCSKALPLPATFRLYSEFGGYQKAAAPRARACVSVWRAPPCSGVNTLFTQH